MNRFFEVADHAVIYKLYRPKTPLTVTKDIVRYVKEKRPSPLRLAIDVGCGSGQNTIGLAEFFDSVIGTDISSAQVTEIIKDNATPSNVTFKVASAEDLSDVATDHSVDLIIGATCIHYFDLSKFFSEVNRVLAPNGTIAVLGHRTEQLCHPTDPILSEKLLQLIPMYFKDKLNIPPATESYFSCYNNLDFPFEDTVRVNSLPYISQVPVSHVIGALTSWSPYQELLREKREEALELIWDVEHRILELVCGEDAKVDPNEVKVHLKYDYFYLMGRVH